MFLILSKTGRNRNQYATDMAGSIIWVTKASEEVISLTCLLANQEVQIWNLGHPDDKREELSTEVVELLTVPADLTSHKSAITAALEEGTRRAIVSGPDPKPQRKRQRSERRVGRGSIHPARIHRASPPQHEPYRGGTVAVRSPARSDRMLAARGRRLKTPPNRHHRRRNPGRYLGG